MFKVTRIDDHDQRAYWIVGAIAGTYDANEHERHAVRKHPGAYPVLTPVTALCGEHIKTPMPAPFGQTPKSAVVQQLCEACQHAVDAESLTAARVDM